MAGTNNVIPPNTTGFPIINPRCSQDFKDEINDLICKETIVDPTKNADITACVDNITNFVNGKVSPAINTINSSDCNNLLLGANYITSITTLITQKEAQIDINKNNIATFKESVDQQVNPETTINARSQRTGIFAPPRPLKPLSVSILLGISFTFFLISLSIVYKMVLNSIPAGSGSGLSSLTLNAVKDISIGLLIIVALILGLKLGNVI